MNRYSNECKAVTSGSKNARYHHNSQYLNLTKPFIVGYMSVDGHRNYHPNLSQLKFLNEIPSRSVYLDLNYNINTARQITTYDDAEKITLLLKFIIFNHDNLKQQMSKPTFISYSRTLISIMCAAYTTNKPLQIYATLFDGSIYLCSIDTPSEIKKRQSRSPQEEKSWAWGYKFKQYLLSDSPSVPPDVHKPVIENEEFSLYYSASLGNKCLLYGAQIDGLLTTDKKVMSPTKPAAICQNLDYLRKHKYVELKTNRVIQNYKQEKNFKKYKLLKCWCQCYLADLKGLLVGFRTDDGVIQHLQWFETEDIVSYCKDEWCPQTAIRFLDYTLSYIQKCFQGESKDFATLQFKLTRKGRIFIDNLENNNFILPQWYVEKWLEK